MSITRIEEAETRGAWVLAVREHFGWSQERFAAELTGVGCKQIDGACYHQPFVSAWERGRTDVPSNVVAALREAHPDLPDAPSPPKAQAPRRRGKGRPSPVYDQNKVDKLRVVLDTYPEDNIPKSVILRWLEVL